MASSTTVIQSKTVLGKRKASSSKAALVLHLASSPEPTRILSESDDSYQCPATSSEPPILINGRLVPPTKRRYKCTYDSCEKAYTKSSRLIEHERTHTGDRPFVCETCQKSYLRETHLHAHARTHLPDSAKPFLCDKTQCGKRFWTSQHLNVHKNWHNGVKPFSCSAEGCDETFSKHHQLRAHECSVHAPPGTKPYQCDHTGCARSFDTNQHLRTHQRTHDENRYTCAHLNCLAQHGEAPIFFQTWTALQHHIRSSHPPSCTHPSCNGRVFTTQKGLRAHQKLHEQRDLEAELDNVAADSEQDNDDATELPAKKKRRGGELGRDWKCDVDGCEKYFKSKKALVTHTNVKHLGKRDYICPEPNCGQAFGYKHLLQRHLSKAHPSSSSEAASSEEEDEEKLSLKPSGSTSFNIDVITGVAYENHAKAIVASARGLRCPYPHLHDLVYEALDKTLSTTSTCGYVFSRAYDFRRHLRGTHGIEAMKGSVESWVRNQRQ